MKEDQTLEVEPLEKTARLRDLSVRRMAKVKAADNRTDCDMWHDAAKCSDGIHNSGMTATGHKDAVFCQKHPKSKETSPEIMPSP